MDKAIELYSKAREELSKDSLGTLSYATSCNNLAFFYFNMGLYEKAELQFLEVKGIREKVLGIEDPKYARTCGNLATLYRRMGLFEKAEPLYLKAKEIQEFVLGKEHLDYAFTINSLANFYADIGQYEAAEALLLEAKRILEKKSGKLNPLYASSCNDLANLYQDLGQFSKAEQLYLEAKQIQEKRSRKENQDYAASCGNLGNLYAKMKQYKKAEQLYIEAKEIIVRLAGLHHPTFTGLCNNLAIIYRKMGSYHKAEMLLIQAMQIQAKTLRQNRPAYAASCQNRANLYVAMKQYKKAELLYIEVKRLMQNAFGTQHHNYGISCENLANLYWLLHKPLKAEKEFMESFSVNTYNVYSVFQFSNEKEKAAFIKNISGEDDAAFSFYMSEKITSGQPYSLSLFHRNLILSSSEALRKNLFYSKNTTLINKYNEWVRLKRQLSIFFAGHANERKEDISTIEEKAGLLEKDLTSLSSAFTKQQQKVNWKDIQHKLQVDEASIEFVSFHYTPADNEIKHSADTVFYIALVLKKSSLLPATVFLFDEKQLKRLLFSAEHKTTRAGVQKIYTTSGVTANSKKVVNKSIYDLIWKPLEKELSGIKTVYFAPSGILHKIAFAALPLNKKEVLSDRYKLVQLATTASVADQQHVYVTTSDKIQLYGGISYNMDTTALKDVALAYHHEKTISRSLPDDLTRGGVWNELPGTMKEITEIVSLSGKYQTNITSKYGINATEESIKSLDGQASPAILHIATHGFFFPDPKQDKKYGGNTESGKVFKLSDDPLMRSGLLFAGANNAWQNKPVEGIDDGILTAYEVSNLYLPNTKLVVLSACETGLGDIQGNEGVYGLQRAFKMAGVNNLVMSLWKVSDAEATEFMEEFYKNLFAKQSISEAFNNTQKVMKNKYRLQPYKWAAWVLVR